MKGRTSSQLYTTLGGTWCWYCGDPKQVMDHAYPASREPSLAPAGMMVIVPSCVECNAIAFDSVQATLAERGEYIKTRLRAKYAELLMIPDWTDEELEPLKGRLRGYVKQGSILQQMVLDRLEWRVDETGEIVDS